MFRRLFARKVRIFGRSIPLAALLLAVVVVAVGAAWIAALTQHVGGSAGTAPLIEWFTADCAITGAPGSVSGCTGAGTTAISGDVAGVEPGSVLTVGGRLRNPGTIAVCNGPVTAAAPYVVVTSSHAPGTFEVGPGATTGGSLILTYAFNDSLLPDQVIDIAADIAWTAGACPP